MNAASILQGANHANVIGSNISAANVMNFNYKIPQTDAVTTAEAPVISILKPNSSALFTGRKDVLDKLANHFAPQSTGDRGAGRRSFLIYGMGGIGKTQICLKFTEQMVDNFDQVFWIDASSEETILLSLKRIAKISGFNESLESAILHWIGSMKENWLLIFDNADLAPEVVEKFIPPGERGNILISSRNASLRRLTTSWNSYELQEMEEEDDISLLLKAACLSAPSTADLNFAKAIVTELCCLPLAIDQAGSSIECGLCNISSYLKLYSSKSKTLLDDPNFRGASKYGRTVYGTWELSFQEIQRRANNNFHEARNAIIILKTFAFFHHSNIKEEIFERAALNAVDWDPEEETNIKLPQIRKYLDCTLLEIDESGQWDSLQFKQGVRLLLSFSLIKQGSTATEYSVHPLVHVWSRERLSVSEQYIQSELAAALLTSSIIWDDQLNDITFRRSLLPHIINHYEAPGKLNLLESYYDDEYDNFGLVFMEVGYYVHALKLQSKSFEMRSKVLGKEHYITLNAMLNLASIYSYLGRFTEAEELNIEGLEIGKRLLGDEHPDTLTRIQNLAVTYSNLGKFLEAVKLEVEVLEMSKRLLGDEHLDTLSRMQNLAATYHSLGRLLEAEKLNVEFLGMSRRLLGDEHPNTLTGMQNLGITYGKLGKYLEAEKLEVAVLEMSKRLLGNEHLDTLCRMENLATTYHSLGRFVEAEKLEIEFLGMSKKLLGSEHPYTLTGMQQLGIICNETGRFLEAEKLFIDVLEISKRLFGDEHPLTLAGFQNLAITYNGIGRFVEAEKLNIEVLETSKRLLGDEHPNTLAGMQHQGILYNETGRFVEAEKVFIEVLEISKRLFGDEHPHTLAGFQNLAITYNGIGRFVEAEKLNIEVLEMSKRLLGDEHPDTLSRLYDLAMTLHSQDKNSLEAKEMCQKVVKLTEKVLGNDHPLTIKSQKTFLEWCDEGKETIKPVVEGSSKGDKQQTEMEKSENVNVEDVLAEKMEKKEKKFRAKMRQIFVRK